jgi:competence protein ComEA
MLKKLLLGISAMVLTMGVAFADVDVNKADKAALDGIKGLGPKTTQTILDERQKGGDFKDWADFQARVKGVKAKSAMKLSAAGLTVNGKPMPGDAGRQPGKPAEKTAARTTSHAPG